MSKGSFLNGDMMELVHQIPVDFGPDAPRLICWMAPIERLELSQVQLAIGDEVAKFVTTKRRDEHLSSRLLLEKALTEWGIDANLLEVRRNEYRAPSVAYLPGTWMRQELPSISIGHSNGWVFVGLIEPGWTIGIDGEPLKLSISEGVFDMMAKGEELKFLFANPNHALELWTSKEAVQKAARLGMNLNPREIKIPIGNKITNISIGNSKIQLVYWAEMGYHLSLALRPEEPSKSGPEERILEETRLAMQADPDWGVGCKTQRKGA